MAVEHNTVAGALTGIDLRAFQRTLGISHAAISIRPAGLLRLGDYRGLAAFRYSICRCNGSGAVFFAVSLHGCEQWTVRRTLLVPLLILFVLTYLATRFRRQGKAKIGNAEAKSGRNAAQVAANIGVASLVMPVLMSPNWVLQSGHGWQIAGFAVLPAMVAALAEAAADTVSSEIGQAVGGEPRMLTTWREVPAGTDGAISFKGTLAGLAAGLLIVLVSMKVLQLSSRVGIFAFGGAVFGSFLTACWVRRWNEKAGSTMTP